MGLFSYLCQSMGKIWSKGLICRFFYKEETKVRVGMLGLDNAGKTTILYQLKYKRHLEALPTIGFNVENIQCGQLDLTIWDVCGGKPKTRALWKHYNQNTGGIIFVVDAADLRRLTMAAAELRWLLTRPELRRVPFLILANKQDLPHALHADNLLQLLHLDNVGQQWTLQECCALSGVGLWEGLEQFELMLLGK